MLIAHPRRFVDALKSSCTNSFATFSSVVVCDLVTWCIKQNHQAADLQLGANGPCLEPDVYCGVSVGPWGMGATKRPERFLTCNRKLLM